VRQAIPGARGVLLGAGLALVLACAGTGRCGQSGAPPDPAATEAARVDKALQDRPELGDLHNLTEEQVDALAAWLVPYVERAGGAEFETRPKGMLGTPENLSDVLHTETKSIIGRIYSVPPDVIERMAEGARAGIPGLLGKYAPSTGAVYLVPDNVAALGQSLGDKATGQDVATLIMAHELGHALQDQVADLDQMFDSLEDLDHFDGMRGITEGQANWITYRVAQELGMEDAFWALSASQGWGKDGLENPGAFSIWMLYGQGMAFSEHHAAQGGTDRLWEIVRDPPRSTTMLFRPERYGQPLQRPQGVSEALAGIEQSLTRTPDWVVADTNLGEAPLRQETLGLPAERVEDVLGAVRWGHERRLFVSGGASVAPRNASLMVIGFDDGQHARDLVELLSDGLESQAQARTAMEKELAATFGTEAREWVVESAPYDRVEGDAVIRRIVGPRTASGARRTADEEQALWVVRDNHLVVVSVSGFRPGNRLDKAVTRLFEQLEAAGF